MSHKSQCHDYPTQRNSQGQWVCTFCGMYSPKKTEIRKPPVIEHTPNVVSVGVSRGFGKRDKWKKFLKNNYWGNNNIKHQS